MTVVYPHKRTNKLGAAKVAPGGMIYEKGNVFVWHHRNGDGDVSSDGLRRRLQGQEAYD